MSFALVVPYCAINGVSDSAASQCSCPAQSRGMAAILICFPYPHNQLKLGPVHRVAGQMVDTELPSTACPKRSEPIWTELMFMFVNRAVRP